MSTIKLEGNASGTGTLTFAAPNTNTNRTITIPDEDITLGGGKVLQVVQNSSTVSSSTTSTSYVDLANATASITPSSTSSKILVLWTSYVYNTLVAGVNAIYSHQVLQNTTVLSYTQHSCESGTGGLQGKGTMAFSILDAPSTTSAVTYKIQHKSNNSSSTGYTNSGFLTLMEIAA